QMTSNSRNPEANIPASPPNCLICRHFKITWEPAFPRACLLFGVKCRTLPSAEVFLSTGKHCFSFEPKGGT
ncbi:MAG: hypothetical protein FWD91_01275, partial [Treponema sp.]|nr:hypothetical protein [Treponema sp.]